MAFNTWFSLAFVLARTELPLDRGAADAQVKEAADALARAARLDPNAFCLWVVDGILREQTGDFEKAVESITKGLAGAEDVKGLQPWQVYQLELFGRLSRGRAFLNLNNNSDHLAKADLEKAAALTEGALKDPLSPTPNYLRRTVLTALASSYQRLEYDDNAERILKELIKEDPANYVHAYNMALMLVGRQRFPEAIEYYEKTAKLNSYFPTPHLKIAYILMTYPQPGKEPDVAEAERRGEIYLRLIGGTGDAEYFSLRGEGAYLRKDMDAAERWFRRALGLDDGCRTALENLLKIIGRKEDRARYRGEIEDLEKRMNENSSGERREKMNSNRAKMTFC